MPKDRQMGKISFLINQLGSTLIQTWHCTYLFLTVKLGKEQAHPLYNTHTEMTGFIIKIQFHIIWVFIN